jgi:hypothetical protein
MAFKYLGTSELSGCPDSALLGFNDRGALLAILIEYNCIIVQVKEKPRHALILQCDDERINKLPVAVVSWP